MGLDDLSDRPLRWAGPLAALALAVVAVCLLTWSSVGSTKAPLPLPLIGLCLAVWTVGLLSMPIYWQDEYSISRQLRVGFVMNTIALLSVALLVLWVSTDKILKEPTDSWFLVAGALRSWASRKAVVAVGLLLLGWVGIVLSWASEGQPGPWPWRPRQRLTPWPPTILFPVGAALFGMSATITWARSRDVERRPRDRAGILATWFWTFLTSVCAIAVYSTGVCTMRGIATFVMLGGCIGFALLLDIAIAPLLLVRAFMLEDGRDLNLHLEGRAQTVRGGSRLDEWPVLGGIIPSDASVAQRPGRGPLKP